MNNKKNRRKPSNRQIAYALDQVSNPGKPKRKSAVDVGYSQSTADHPVERIENTQGFQTLKDLIKVEIPDSEVISAIKRGMSAVTTGKFGGEEDWATRRPYVEMRLKITGDFAPTKMEHAISSHSQLLAALEQGD